MPWVGNLFETGCHKCKEFIRKSSDIPIGLLDGKRGPRDQN
jgi:hypothetical protein